MRIGVPKEIKRDEYRVAMLPVGVEELTQAGHQVIIEAGAGLGSGLTDAEYAAVGATIVATGAEVFAQADLIVKVKEPLPAEWPLIRPGQIVFTYFHWREFQERVRAGFLAEAARRQDIVVVDASQEASAVHAEVVAAAERVLSK